MSGDEMDCNEFVELVSDYLDGVLDWETHARLDSHMVDCEGCGNYLAQFRVTVLALGGLGIDDLDIGFRNRLLDALNGWSPT